MNTYYLQQKQNHIMIDNKHHNDYTLLNQIQAKSWIHAKQLFGFELTFDQEYKLSQQQ